MTMTWESTLPHKGQTYHYLTLPRSSLRLLLHRLILLGMPPKGGVIKLALHHRSHREGERRQRGHERDQGHDWRLLAAQDVLADEGEAEVNVALQQAGEAAVCAGGCWSAFGWRSVVRVCVCS